ncbi:helix-turn-helix domain-containing protein [Actinomadura sp. NPDC047616]|uniref:TetR/AcrR family transcriptional regulator n=1 Tax=Actinomadura sp. NPDC047616 TaxID=3155914 RepID=UPI0033D887CB
MSGPARRGPGRPPKSEAGDTKAALVEAALRLFAQKGFAGTSIRAIAREVGLSESVLYAHFPSKRAIFEAALGRLGPQGVAGVLADIDPALADRDPPGFVRELVRRVVDRWDTPDGRLLTSLMVRDGLVHDPAMAANLDDAMERVAAFFTRWIRAGAVSADLGAPFDLAYALLAPVGQARVLWLHADATSEQRATARERAARHTELFVRAVFGRPDPH